MSAEQIGMDVSFEQEQRAVQSAGDTGNDGGGDGGGYELDENGQRVPHGMGQSKSSRRRRRKRKMKVGETAGGAESSDQEGDDSPSASASPAEGTVASVQAASPAARTQQGGGRNAPNGGQSFNGQNGNGVANGPNNGQNVTPGGTKRWKKKFRERDRPRAAGENPGNQTGGSGFRENGGSGRESSGFSGPSASNGGGFSGGGGQFRGPDTHQPGNGGGGFKRKGGFGSGSGGSKQGRSGGGARGGFVGPMDHSYRAVNGNFADTPPSTMDPYSGGGRRGGYSGDSQPIDYSQGRAIPIAADAPTHIYFFIEDLFITAKIQETARKLGVKVAFVKNDKESIAQLTAGEDNDRPSLIVFDLNNANAKPMTLMPKLKAKLKKSVSIVGFLSHLQGDLKAKAMESGCDTVMPRAAFSQNLPNLLRRYGVEDTEEVANYNQ